MKIASWTVCCPIFVQIFGLMSCTKTESVSTDVFRIPEPVWHLEKKDIKFNEANLAFTEHQLTDKLDLTSSPDAVLIVSPRCSLGTRVWASTESFRLPRLISLFAMLPREVLAPSITQSGIRCGIDFQAISPSGAAHKFHMAESLLTDSSKSVGVESPDALGAYKESDFSKFRFFASVAGSNGFVLRCENFEAKSLHTHDGEVWLSDFDFAGSGSFRIKPAQRCRILALSEADQVTGLSMPLELRFHPLVPKITYTPVGLSTGEFPFEQPREIMKFELRNDEPIDLRLELARPRPEQIAVYFLTLDPGTHARDGGGVGVPCPSANLLSPVDAELTAAEGTAEVQTVNSAAIRIEMPPGSVFRAGIRIGLDVHAKGMAQVYGWSSIAATTAAPFDMKTFLLNDDGEWSETATVQWGDVGTAWFTNPGGHFLWKNDFHLDCELPASPFFE